MATSAQGVTWWRFVGRTATRMRRGCPQKCNFLARCVELTCDPTAHNIGDGKARKTASRNVSRANAKKNAAGAALDL